MADLKLVDAGAHSVGVNNSNDRQFVSATPEFKLTSPLEFTSIGGTNSAPTMQHADTDKINVGDELWFKPTGSNACVRVEVGGVSEGGGGAGSQSLIAQNTGTAIGYMTGYGGLAAAFDGNTDKASGSCAGDSTHTTGSHVGKDLGSAHYISGFKAWPSNNVGFCNAYLWTESITLRLYGSNTSPANATDGTLLDTTTFTDQATVVSRLSAFSATTAYRYVWLTVSDAGNNAGYFVAQVEFYETPQTPYTYTLSSLSPAQAALPEKVFKIRSDKAKEMMHIARGILDATFVDGDFSNASAIASVAYAAGPELTVTGSKVTFSDDATKKRLALRLRGDFTTVGARAKSAKLYTEERTA